jgi:hypothetical protein
MAMARFADILNQIRSRHPQFSKKLDEADAVSRWGQCVGTAISNHTRPIRVEAQVLWVEVDHPAWKSELLLRKQQILDKLNTRDAESPAKPNQKKPEVIIDLLFLDPRKPFSFSSKSKDTRQDPKR